MTIQFMSDLHLESPKAYDVFEIVPKAPVLALVGDIGYAEDHKADLALFFERQLRQFRAVLFIAGNHEAYGSSWPRCLAALRSLEEEFRIRRSKDEAGALGELVVLDRGVYRVSGEPHGTFVVGCSLFSSVPPERAMAVEMGLNDFYRTDDWNIESHNCAHARDLAWLNKTVAELEEQTEDEVHDILIMTHWSPTLDPRAQDPRHIGSDRTSAFATDLSEEACFRSKKVKTWVFGHTHFNCDFIVERGDSGTAPLRLVTNQRGYYFSQSAGFDNDRTL